MNDIQRFVDAVSLAQGAARLIAEAGRAAIDAHGVFYLALSGGSTPRATYQALADMDLDWAKVQFFWGDERCVPPDDPESNYRMARQTLLEPLGIAASHVFRMACESDPGAGAQAYEDRMRQVFAGQIWPRLDVILLGVGDEGHTASLFPGTPALDEGRRWVAANHVAAKQAWRMTLTLPVINAAAMVVFLVQGDAKAEIVRRVLETQAPDSPFPAGRVLPETGKLVWLVDQAAASLLKV